MAGTVATTAEAMMMPKFSDRPRPTKVARPTGSVRVASEWVTISGQKNSFQLRTKVKMATVASAGPGKGQEDAPQQAEAVTVVEATSLLQFHRYGAEKLHHQEDAEGVGRGGHGQAEITVDDAQFAQPEEERHQQDLAGQQRRDGGIP